MLLDTDMFGQVYDKVRDSIQLLKDFEPDDGYYLAFSGGKDSICIKRLADMADVKYDAHYSVTTIDPPELVRFIRKEHPDVKFDHPEVPFLRKMETRGFPQRQRRWCCELYKERGGTGRKVVTGVRKAESAKRAGRRAVEICYKDKSKTYVNPIINWTDVDVWQFIKENNIPYCSLYDEGWTRLGCLLCPMSGKSRMREAERYPKYTELFIKSFEKIYQNKKAEGRASIDRWKDGEEMFWWWMREDRKSEDPDQTVLFE